MTKINYGHKASFMHMKKMYMHFRATDTDHNI